MKKIKLQREWSGCYTYEHYTIEKEECCLGGSKCYWYCDQLATGTQFRTLKGVRKALELKLKGQLTSVALEECSDM